MSELSQIFSIWDYSVVREKDVSFTFRKKEPTAWYANVYFANDHTEIKNDIWAQYIQRIDISNISEDEWTTLCSVIDYMISAQEIKNTLDWVSFSM